MGDIHPIHKHTPFIRRQKSYDMLDQYALSRPAPPNHHHRLATINPEIHAAKDMFMVEILM